MCVIGAVLTLSAPAALSRARRRSTRRTTANNPLPEIVRAEFVDPPVLADPSGQVVPVSGNAVLQLVMSNASGVDLSVDPPVQTYTGPTRIEANLPNVVEVVETGDFESVLSWAIGVHSGAGGATAQVLRIRSNPVWTSSECSMSVPPPLLSSAVRR